MIECAADERRAAVLVAARFGSGGLRLAAERRELPWVGVNSTFYIGPNPPRPLEADFGARPPPFRDFFAPNLDRATRVLHASDRSTSASQSSPPIIILVPWGRDQGGVAARAEQLGAAVVISRDQLTPELLETAARRLPGDPSSGRRWESVLLILPRRALYCPRSGWRRAGPDGRKGRVSRA